MKKRLDVLLTEKGLAPSREKAKALLMAGLVYVNNQKEDKAGTMFPEDAYIQVRGQGLRYVSRGGLKLEKALRCFPISLDGRVCMDIGASTGGFTDCMLQNGAAKVYAIDVGYGQLDWKLREDPRVVCMEKTNFRYVRPEDLDPAWMPDFASVDVSFISLAKILPPARAILPDDGEMVCLIKPQFEAGREKVGKKGVVRDPKVHEEVIETVLRTAQQTGFSIQGLSWSPIRGPEGNIEYLLHLRCRPQPGRTETAEDANGTEPASAATNPAPLVHDAPPVPDTPAVPPVPDTSAAPPVPDTSAAPPVPDTPAAPPVPAASAKSPQTFGPEQIHTLVLQSHTEL